MITAQEARDAVKRMDGLWMELVKLIRNSGLDEIRGLLVYLASVNEDLAEENNRLKERLAKLEKAAGVD